MPKSDPLFDALKRVKQDAKAPHPGTLTFRYLWNNSVETGSSASWSDGNIFYCWNEKDEVVPRDEARWCVPLVEFETLSVDANGKPVPPNKADFISIKKYGPNHTYVGSMSTPPTRTPPPAFRVPDAIPPAPASAPHSFGPEVIAPLATNDASKASWWSQVKRWIRLS